MAAQNRGVERFRLGIRRRADMMDSGGRVTVRREVRGER